MEKIFEGIKITDWIQAVGTVVAIFLTAVIALAGYLSELRRRANAAHSAVLLAEQVGLYAFTAVERLEKQMVSGPLGPGITPTISRLEINSAVWLELLELMGQVSPTDLPDIATSSSYIHIRSQVRRLHIILRDAAALWKAGRDPYFGPLDLAPFKLAFSRERVELTKHARYALHPLRPKWLVRRKLRKLEKTYAEYERMLTTPPHSSTG